MRLSLSGFSMRDQISSFVLLQGSHFLAAERQLLFTLSFLRFLFFSLRGCRSFWDGDRQIMPLDLNQSGKPLWFPFSLSDLPQPTMMSLDEDSEYLVFSRVVDRMTPLIILSQ